MQAVILAAGEGLRLRPFTHDEPKVMLPVGGRPLLEHGVRALVAAGVNDLIVVVGYHRERIMSHLGDGSDFGATIAYVVEEKQLGTLHALASVEGEVAGRFLVLPGDIVVAARTITDLLAADADAVLVTESRSASRYGVVDVRAGRAHGQHEETVLEAPVLVSTGLYSLSPAIFPVIRELLHAGHHKLRDLVDHLGRGAGLLAVHSTGDWRNAVFPWDLLLANDHVLDDLVATSAGVIEEGVTVRGPVAIGAGTRVRAGAYLEGPINIGSGCDIGPNCVITGATSIGDNVVVDANCVLRHSLVMDDVQVGVGSLLEHSILGSGVRVGALTVASPGPAEIRVGADHYPVDQVGAMIGPDSELGSQVSLAPGTVVGARCRIGSGARLSATLEDDTRVL